MKRRDLANLPPGSLPSVWEAEGYVDAACWCRERAAFLETLGGMAREEAEREAVVLARQWWRSLPEAQRRRAMQAPSQRGPDRPGG